MRAPSVSVIVPVHNGLRVLPACLAALRNQDYPADAFEVIVVDDGSTDGTAQMVETTAADWAKAQPRLTLRIVRQAWRGAGAARNLGVRQARGAFVLCTDADCEPVAGWISAMLAPFDDPQVAAVAGGYLTRQTSLVARLAQAEFEQRYRLLSRYRTVDIAFTHSAAYRRTVFQAARGFDERMPNNGEDLEFSYRLASSGQLLVFAPKGLVFHRHPDTFSEYARKKFGRGFWRTLVFKRYPKKLVRDAYTPQLLKLQIILLGLAPLFLLAWLLGMRTWLGGAGMLSAGVFLVTTLPFVYGVRHSRVLSLAAPLFLFVRAAAIGAGVVCGSLDRIERYEIGGRRSTEPSAGHSAPRA